MSSITRLSLHNRVRRGVDSHLDVAGIAGAHFVNGWWTAVPGALVEDFADAAAPCLDPNQSVSRVDGGCPYVQAFP